MAARELNFSPFELRKMMFELEVDETVDISSLKASFIEKIRSHHTDKGGNAEKAKDLTRAYRILKNYLEARIRLPVRGDFPNQYSHPSDNYRSASRRNYQGQSTASDGFDDFGDFQQPNRRRRKGGGIPQRDYQNGRGRQFEQDGAGEDEGEEFPSSSYDTRPVFINGYTYDAEDYSSFEDPMENASSSTTERMRKVRGGLVLQMDFLRNAILEEEYEEIGKLGDENAMYMSPLFTPLLEKLKCLDEDVYSFTEKMKVFVNLDWACSEEIQSKAIVKKAKLLPVENDDTGSLFTITIPLNQFEAETFSPGLHVDVRSSNETRFFASALVDDVDEKERKVVLFFLDPMRMHTLLAVSRYVDISINASAFVFRSLIRSIDYVQTRKMTNLVFPSLSFAEPFVEFEARRDAAIEQMDFSQVDGFNMDQKKAVYSIVKRSSQPYPFILFGPPGTGKTITLVESICHIVQQSKENRVLVCTPSKMAADNFAEALVDREAIDPKYIFRMHSLSTSAIGRTKKLDKITYLPKEGRNKFYGIPPRSNLKMFRVIICTLSASSYLISAGGLRGFFTHILVDEAGQATEADTWVPIGGLATHNTSVILAGDPKQLGPVVNMQIARDFGFDVSMLKRLIGSKGYESADDRSFVVLKHTYRSHLKILRPCSYLFYDNMLVANEEDEFLYKLCEWNGLPKKGFPIIFHSSNDSHEESGHGSNKSFSNPTEIQLVCSYVERILAETDIEEKDIGVISPYKNQVLKLRTVLSKYPRITIDSVEGFQGCEREVIIISTVRTEYLGFLRCDLRLNTSISRAKSLLIVVGNDELLKQHLSWKKFIFYCNFHGGYLDNKGKNCTELADVYYGDNEE